MIPCARGVRISHSLTLLQGHSQDAKHGPPESLDRLLRGERRRERQERRDDEDRDEVGENQEIPVDDYHIFGQS